MNVSIAPAANAAKVAASTTPVLRFAATSTRANCSLLSETQSYVIRQPLFWASQRIRRDRYRASDLVGEPSMITTKSLHVVVHHLVPSEMSLCWLLPCRRASIAGAFTPRFAPSSALPSNAHVSCLERARLMAVVAFAGALAAGAAAPPGRRCPERRRGAKAEGEIKGRGTTVRAKSVCTWDWRSTRRITAPCRPTAPGRMHAGAIACRLRGSTPRNARTDWRQATERGVRYAEKMARQRRAR